MEINPSLILQSVLPVYGLIVLGFVLRRVRILKKEADGVLMSLVIKVLYPSLIIDKILGSEAVRDLKLCFWSVPVGFCIILLGLGLARVGARLFGLEGGKARRTFTLTAGVQNYGFAAVPIVIALFPSDVLGVLFVHSLGVEIALWSFGIAALKGQFPRQFRKILSAPVLAVLLGLGLVHSGAAAALQGADYALPLRQLLNWLGACSFPLALLLVGATLSDECRALSLKWRVLSGAVSVRLLALPLLLMSAVYLLPMPVVLKQVVIVQAAMPSAVMPIVLSRLYGGDGQVAIQVVLVTQIIGLLTIPLWIGFGLSLLG